MPYWFMPVALSAREEWIWMPRQPLTLVTMFQPMSMKLLSVLK